MMSALRRRSRIVVACMAVGLATAAALSWRATPRYSSSAQLFVNVSSTTDSASAYEGNLFVQQRVASYARILEGTQLAQKVVDALALPLSADQVAGEVTATPIPNTVVINVRVEDASPKRAQAIAATLVRQFSGQVAALETPGGGTTSRVRVDTIQDASYNSVPMSPHPAANMARGAAVGLLLGLLIMWVRERLDGTVRTERELRDATGLEVLARVPDDARQSRLMRRKMPNGLSRVADGAREVASYLQVVGASERCQIVALTSAIPEQGTSTLALGLAAALARSGHRVVLIDADLSRPRTPALLGLPEAPGLVEVLQDKASFDDVTHRLDDVDLVVLPPGALPRHPGELLTSRRMQTLLRQLRRSHDFVVIDSAPVLAVPDSATLAGLADTCLLVVRYGDIGSSRLNKCVGALRRLKVHVPGIVLTRVPGAARRVVVGHSYAPRRGRASDNSRTGWERTSADDRPPALTGPPDQEPRALVGAELNGDRGSGDRMRSADSDR